jgi:hypothetical protein
MAAERLMMTRMFISIGSLAFVTAGCSEKPCNHRPDDAVNGESLDQVQEVIEETAPDSEDAETIEENPWAPLSCDDYWSDPSQYYFGSSPGRYFPAGLSLSDDARYLYYEILFLPAELTEGEWPQPMFLIYRVNLIDNSMTYVSSLPGPRMACGELRTWVDDHPEAVSTVYESCLVFGEGRYRAMLARADRCDWSCSGPLSWEEQRIPCGYEDPMPEIWRQVIWVGGVEDAVDERLGWLLEIWWVGGEGPPTDRSPDIGFPEMGLGCFKGSVHPGTSGIPCSELFGPCCRCDTDSDCENIVDRSRQCTGVTEDGIRFCQ